MFTEIKEKEYYDYHKGILEKRFLKQYSLHASKPTPASIVKDDSYGNFQCPRDQYKIDRKKPVPCASDFEA